MGSTVFAQNIIGDLMSNPILADSEFALFDIDVGVQAEDLALNALLSDRPGAVRGDRVALRPRADLTHLFNATTGGRIG